MSVIGDRILLATDGSPEAESAAGMAVTLSEKLGSGLHVVCVEPMPDPLSWPESRVVAPELGGDIRERAEVEARKKLEGEAEKIRKMGVEVSGVHAGVGRPDAEIVRVAEELGAGLVVVGSRGLGPVRRAVMGSVSGSVVHHSHCSVLVVRDHDGEDSPPGGILLAVDGSGQAQVATEVAVEISASTGSRLHVVFVMPAAEHLYGPHFYSEEMKGLRPRAGRRRRQGVSRRACGVDRGPRRQRRGHAHGRRQTRRGDSQAGRGTAGRPDRGR